MKIIKCESIKEVISNIDDESLFIAGGTDLVVRMREGLKVPGNLIDISTISEMQSVVKEEEYIVLGAGLTHSEIEKDETIIENLPLLSKASSKVGSTQIRNRGTIGGNVSNCSSCADTIPPLLIYDANAILETRKGEKEISLEEYIENRCNMKNDLIVAFKMKPLKGYIENIYKVSRRQSLAVSRLTLCTALKVADGLIEDVRICPGAMLSEPRRLHKTENEFKGKEYNKKNIEKLVQFAVDEVRSIAGIRWSSPYKEPVLRGLLLRQLLNEEGEVEE